MQGHSGGVRVSGWRRIREASVATAARVRQRMLDRKGSGEVRLEGLFRAPKTSMRPLHLLLSERAPLEGVQQSSHNLRVAFQLPCGAQENRMLTKREWLNKL